jgi:tetratricopeptide (TPR) repeat protein
MKHFIQILLLAIAFTSCKTSKDYLQRGNEDRTLFDIVKKLNKSPNDVDALKALPIVFDNVTKLHVNKVAKYSSYKEITRWDKIVDEYTSLQKIYDAVSSSNTASSLVTAVNYQNDIYNTKQTAAEDYYNTALQLMQNQNRDEIKKAYTYFKKATKLVPNYSDAKIKMQEAFDAATINVLINPVQDNSFFFNTGWGNTGYNYSNEYFQQNLVRELGAQNANRYPARFYTEWEARRDNVKPDWVVNLTLRNLDIPRPQTYTSQRNVSKEVETGRDTAGRIIYQTVYATIYTNRQSFTARGEMDVNITDANTRRYITSGNYNDDYSWQQETATYSGDNKALSSSDWNLINSRNYNQPTKEEVLNELYRKIYPQVKNKISYAVDW